MANSMLISSKGFGFKILLHRAHGTHRSDVVVGVVVLCFLPIKDNFLHKLLLLHPSLHDRDHGPSDPKTSSSAPIALKMKVVLWTSTVAGTTKGYCSGSAVNDLADDDDDDDVASVAGHYYNFVPRYTYSSLFVVWDVSLWATRTVMMILMKNLQLQEVFRSSNSDCRRCQDGWVFSFEK